MTTDEEILDKEAPLIVEEAREFILRMMKLAREDILAQIKKLRSEGKYILYCPDAPKHKYLRAQASEQKERAEKAEAELERSKEIIGQLMDWKTVVCSIHSDTKFLEFLRSKVPCSLCQKEKITRLENALREIISLEPCITTEDTEGWAYLDIAQEIAKKALQEKA